MTGDAAPALAAGPHQPDPAAWMAGAFCAALAAGLAVLALFGRSWGGVALATATVARVAFVFFWLAYAGSALAVLFGRTFDGLARRRRAFGLAFAAALFVHLCFVAWLFHISARPPLPPAVVLLFVIGAGLTYALALASLPVLRRLADGRAWRLFTIAAMEYIAYLFFRDFALLPFWYRVPHPTTLYLPFAIVLVVGAGLRWTAMARRAGDNARLYGARR